MNPYGETAPLVDPDDFVGWIIQEDDDLLIVNKPSQRSFIAQSRRWASSSWRSNRSIYQCQPE